MPTSVCLQVVIRIERVGQCQDREDCIGSQSYRAEKTGVSCKIHVHVLHVFWFINLLQIRVLYLNMWNVIV